MALRCKLQRVASADADQQVSVADRIVLTKDHDRLEHLGLTLGEAKALLLEVQRPVLDRQVATFLASRTPCPTCGRSRGSKDRKTIAFRTLFGKLELASPRLRRCPCQRSRQASPSPLIELLPEHIPPELLYLESKWASLISDGLRLKALRDFLPVAATLNVLSVRRDTLRADRRLEAELGREPVFPRAGCPAGWASLPTPPGADHRRLGRRLPARLGATRSRGDTSPRCSGARVSGTPRRWCSSRMARSVCASCRTTCARTRSIGSTGSTAPGG
jgi:hypothetical protein